jgi:hypothetical protein
MVLNTDLKVCVTNTVQRVISWHSLVLAQLLLKKKRVPLMEPEYSLLWSHVQSTQFCSWLRHCAGYIPDGVIEFFNLLNPSSHMMALGSTQLLTEMSIRKPAVG